MSYISNKSKKEIKIQSIVICKIQSICQIQRKKKGNLLASLLLFWSIAFFERM